MMASSGRQAYTLKCGNHTVFKSESPVTLHQWHRAEIWRTGKGILMKVDRQSWVESQLVSIRGPLTDPGILVPWMHEEGEERLLPAKLYGEVQLSQTQLSPALRPGFKFASLQTLSILIEQFQIFGFPGIRSQHCGTRRTCVLSGYHPIGTYGRN
ncbi:hypothetical protein GCK32_011115 [Trichostrongylus colubriformis]|uniref:Uncharacterized protein n=1 Tax=Trichostrongylus colubriformis TaxID=6319 RepID=A0AAN8IUN7_TRICO